MALRRFLKHAPLLGLLTILTLPPSKPGRRALLRVS
jgi:hypothetical protein